MKKLTSVIAILFALSALSALGVAAYAQQDNNYQDLPSHLRPAANAADQNILIQIFGDIARVASGQMELSDLVLDPEDGSVGPMQTDSVLSGMMMIYLLGIMGFTGVMLLVLIILMALQSSIEGKVLTQRYNEWAIIRTLYAVFAILPAAGGWSIGQFAILNGTFIVNSMTNEMHTFSNKWVFARGTAGSVNLEPFEFRRIAEAVYLNEMCAAAVNRYYEQEEGKFSSNIARLTERMTFIERDTVRNAIDRAVNNLKKAYNIESEGLGPYTVQRNKIEQSSALESFTIYTPNAGFQTIADRYSQLLTIYEWGNEKQGEGICGSVVVDFGRFLVKEGQGGGVSERTLTAYYRAHEQALDNLVRQAESDIKEVTQLVFSLQDDTDSTEKIDRKEAITAEFGDERVAAFSGYFDDLIDEVGGDALDSILRRRVADYIQTIRVTYNSETDEQADLFDQLITELQRQQSGGSGADYQAAYDDANVELPEGFEGIADESVMPLLENTRKGWLYAGYKWWDVSRAMANSERLASHRPTFTSYRNTLDRHPEEIQRRLGGLSEKYARTVTLRGAPSLNPTDEDGLADAVLKGDPQEAYKNTRGALSLFATGLINSIFSEMERGDALMSIQRGGHRLLTASATFFSGAVASRVIGASAGTGGGWAVRFLSGGTSSIAGTVLETIMFSIAKFMTFIAFLFLAVGILYAVYLPLLPAMIWTFGIIGWLEKLIALIIIMPLWMAGHIIPDGDGLINGVGRQGYVLTANVLMRPPVMVLSMHFAIVVLDAITAFLADFYNIFIPSAHAGYTSGLFVTVGSFVVFSGFLVVVAHMILNWSFKIPDDIPSFLGGSGGNHGEGEARGHSQAIAGMMFSQTQGSSSLMGGGGGDPNQRGRGMGRRGRGRGGVGRAAQSKLGF